MDTSPNTVRQFLSGASGSSNVSLEDKIKFLRENGVPDQAIRAAVASSPYGAGLPAPGGSAAGAAATSYWPTACLGFAVGLLIRHADDSGGIDNVRAQLSSGLHQAQLAIRSWLGEDEQQPVQQIADIPHSSSAPSPAWLSGQAQQQHNTPSALPSTAHTTPGFTPGPSGVAHHSMQQQLAAHHGASSMQPAPSAASPAVNGRIEADIASIQGQLDSLQQTLTAVLTPMAQAALSPQASPSLTGATYRTAASNMATPAPPGVTSRRLRHASRARGTPAALPPQPGPRKVQFAAQAAPLHSGADELPSGLGQLDSLVAAYRRNTAGPPTVTTPQPSSAPSQAAETPQVVQQPPLEQSTLDKILHFRQVLPAAAGTHTGQAGDRALRMLFMLLGRLQMDFNNPRYQRMPLVSMLFKNGLGSLPRCGELLRAAGFALFEDRKEWRWAPQMQGDIQQQSTLFVSHMRACIGQFRETGCLPDAPTVPPSPGGGAPPPHTGHTMRQDQASTPQQQPYTPPSHAFMTPAAHMQNTPAPLATPSSGGGGGSLSLGEVTAAVARGETPPGIRSLPREEAPGAQELAQQLAGGAEDGVLLAMQQAVPSDAPHTVVAAQEPRRQQAVQGTVNMLDLPKGR